MILSTFVLFFLYYIFSIKRDQMIFKNSGWLYFLSHYQLFLFGVIVLVMISFSLIVGFTYSFFFYDSSSLFFSILLTFLFLPFSIDSISYGLFGISFFKEQYVRTIRLKNVDETKTSFSFNCFFFHYVKFLYFLIALFFFIFSYLSLYFVYVFLIWSFHNEKNLIFIYIFLIENHFLSLLFFIIFVIPFCMEIMSYAYRGFSYFKKYVDY